MDFFDSLAGQAAQAVLLVGIVDCGLEILAAYRDDKFHADTMANWIRTDLAGVILPIWLLLFLGNLAAGLEFANVPLLLVAGMGAATLYVVETVAAITKTWLPRNKPTNGV